MGRGEVKAGHHPGHQLQESRAVDETGVKHNYVNGVLVPMLVLQFG